MRCFRTGGVDETAVPGLTVYRLLRLMACLALLAIFVPSTAQAEMSGDDYRSAKTLTSPAEGARAAAELEAERRRASEMEAQRAAMERAHREQAALLLAQRPLGERLLHERCTGCHALAVTDGLARGAIGWRLTVERMRWWHGAKLGAGEAAAIAAQLRATRPATALGEWLEAALAASCMIIVATAPFAWRKLRKRRGANR